ncbi:MAG: DUF1294 domain-containing protein [Clostridiales bacterium]|nr:DUF1294 domain-containing protein [Clostridiales bacterium]
MISLIGFCLSAADKFAAIKGRRRIREKSLFLVAFLGGAAGMYLSMLLFRHKTKHKRFMITLPVIIVIQFFFIIKFVI